jgi:hypothetical protein
MNKHPQRLLVGTTIGATDGAAVGQDAVDNFLTFQAKYSFCKL